MKKYDPKKIEKKWQRQWEKDGIYRARSGGKKEKYYVLDMFPYPSGEGLHVGHPKAYIGTDILSRFKRMNGFNVLHPMGWDAFGLPAENYAIKHKIKPQVAVKQNVKRFKNQLSMIGLDYDWSREVNTTDPEYYKWTQWAFLQMLKRGLAYESHEPINWCPKCKTGLANEDLEDGRCERCDSVVIKKPMRQWVLSITKYADKLLDGLTDLEWPESIKESQRNWIGRSEGSFLDFSVEEKLHFVLLHGFRGSPKRNFFPWLKKELEKQGHTVEVPELPNSSNPDILEQTKYVLEHYTFDENTVLLGHSHGGAVAMKVAEKLGKPIRKLILAASFLDPHRAYSTEFNWQYNFKKIRKNTLSITVIKDENDNVIPSIQADKLSEATGGEIISIRAAETHITGRKEPGVLDIAIPKIRVFTTRADTVFGATYMVLAPEHSLLGELKPRITNSKEVERYIAEAGKKSEIERSSEEREKTGVKLKGVTVRNPATDQMTPVYIADYVLAGYGTGAIMAVPAHDERDYAFARKYKLPIKEVVRPVRIDDDNPPKRGKKNVARENVHAIVFDEKGENVLCLKWKKHPWTTFVVGGVDDGEDPVEAARREVREETGYENLKFLATLGPAVRAEYYAAHKGENRVADTTAVVFKLTRASTQGEIDKEERERFDITWKPFAEITPGSLRHSELSIWLERLAQYFKSGLKDFIYTGEGVLVNSGTYDGLDSETARKKITADLGGEQAVTYRLKDWVFSRQRYWGEPIPLVHCEHCGVVPVPEKELPVTLPNVRSYEPTGTGESPLAAIPSWVNTKCPKCNGKATRETNTMPQWAGSCWYYLRYTDPQNTKALASKKNVEYWLGTEKDQKSERGVDMYVGGVEHATRHLIYARFWHRFLYEEGVVGTKEPFRKLKNQGLIAGSDGRKMSKRFGNVVTPDSVIERFGADSFRLYEMFMGPFEQGAAWSDENIIGVRRFLEKVWRVSGTVDAKSKPSTEDLSLLHRTIKQVTENIEQFSFNTGVSTLMILVNRFDERGEVSKKEFETFLKLLAPYAPHLSEELYHALGNSKSVHISSWPQYDEKKITQGVVTVAVQVNGKVRAELSLEPEAGKEEVFERVYALPAVRKWIEGKEVKKEIYVPGKIINLVV